MFLVLMRIIINKKEESRMTLFEAEKGISYVVKGLFVEEAVTRRLQALGVNDGTCLTVLNRKRKGALIIKVRGTRLALGKHIAAGIEVEENGEVEKEHE